ncbi:MAG: ChaN family lipoprotein [Alphaproteobacteria bacterium]|nr:ChaN family lipoprotein [Alphaproteobacteria bacterium]
MAGKIWDVAQGAFITEAELIAQLAEADFALLGETHTNEDHHRLQARIVAGLGALGDFEAVAFEMLDQSQAPALARHLDQSETPEALAEGLGRAVNWQRWPSWRTHYQQIAEAALTSGMTIVAGNAENAVLREAVRLGAEGLDQAFVARTKFDVPLGPAALDVLNAELTEAHCGMDTSTIASLVTAQRVWDSSMADALVDAGRSILIAGAGHTGTDRAVPWVLGHMQPEASVAALAFVEVAADFDSPQDYAAYFRTPTLPYQFLWFTPGATLNAEVEPC